MRTIAELIRLDGRTALVAGGAGHIGAAACGTLAELGASVVVLDRDGARAEEVARRLRDSGKQATAITADLADESEARGAPARAAKAYGRLDILVHAAAFVNQGNEAGYATAFERQESRPWRHALEVNLTSAFVLVQAAAPLLRASGHGAVILFGSTYGLVGPDMRLYDGTSLGNSAAYAASKGGALQLTRWLATALAPEIRVNAISPGGIWRDHPESFAARYGERTPLARMGREEDVTGAVAYLASDLSAYVTGHNLVVDGGWTAW
ncbi:MAG: SDR family oxidoreductase [Alphaproteobacteria bacterium]